MSTRSLKPWRRAYGMWAVLAASALVCGCAVLRGEPLPVCDLTPVSLDEPVPVSPAPEAVATNEAVVVEAAGVEPSPAPAAVAPAPAGITDYRVQPLDSLRVEVFGEPDISGVFPVSAEGNVRHPLLGSLEVAGMTVAAVERRFVDVLGTSYLVNPRVSVRVEHSTGRRVTILGEIKKPGTYSLPPEQPLTLLGLVATAGGFTDIADAKRVRILRDTGDARDNTIRVNVNDLLRGRLEQTDVKLLPGDVVMIPEAIF